MEGLTCHLPFVYKNKTYDECTREDSDSLWCHTGARDLDNQLVRGDCQPGCASKSEKYFLQNDKNILIIYFQSAATPTWGRSASFPSSSTGRRSPGVRGTRSPGRACGGAPPRWRRTVRWWRASGSIATPAVIRTRLVCSVL